LSRHPWGPPAAIELIRDSTTAPQRANPQKIPDSVELNGRADTLHASSHRQVMTGYRQIGRDLGTGFLARNGDGGEDDGSPLFLTRVKQSPLVTHLFYLCINFCESVVVPLADSRKTSPEFASLLNLLCWQVVERTVNWHHLTQSLVDWRVISICWRRRLFRPGLSNANAARAKLTTA
jgi:hypothetical protein